MQRLRDRFSRGPSREVVHDHARRLLDGRPDRLDDGDRERLELLLRWLDRPEPGGEFPGRRTGILDTARDDVKSIWRKVHGSDPW